MEGSACSQCNYKGEKHPTYPGYINCKLYNRNVYQRDRCVDQSLIGHHTGFEEEKRSGPQPRPTEEPTLIVDAPTGIMLIAVVFYLIGILSCLIFLK